MSKSEEMDGERIKEAARVISEADGLLIGVGAGMGVDSGLPDFRGNAGFWKAYPPFAKLGLSFVNMANPRFFDEDPSLAWGFYGHRLQLYRDTKPHGGFDILRKWGESMPMKYFVYTSNVDGQFQKGGFHPDRVLECHGSIHHLQCASCCTFDIWSAESTDVEVDKKTFRAEKPLPSCPKCKGVARPNILMFGDWGWIEGRTGDQQRRFDEWVTEVRGTRLALVECGAGTAVPSVRFTCESMLGLGENTLIRINPREPHGPQGTLSFPHGALATLQAIDEAL